MEWYVCMGFAFLVVISVILWGGSQGWYSKKIKIRSETVVKGENCSEYKLEIERLKGKVFEQSLELDAKTAKINELTRNVTELMNAINDLTTKLQAAEAINARMAQSLKNALEDLDKKSRQLQECTAHLTARRIITEQCHMTPESANLIR